jgi:hypothetical protein
MTVLLECHGEHRKDLAQGCAAQGMKKDYGLTD